MRITRARWAVVVAASGFAMALAGASNLAARAQQAAAAPPVSFNRDIRPILANNCFACHGPDEKQRETKFHFDTQEGAFVKAGVIERGNAAESLLIEKITDPDPKERMPPPDSGHVLTPRQIELLRRWIDEGAKWDTHWAYTRTGAARSAGGQPRPVGPQSDRSVHPRAARTRRADAVARSRQDDAAAPRDIRSDRSAADAGRGRRVPRRPRRPTRTRSGSMRCCSPRITASGWPCPGSTPPATPTRTASTSTASAACGPGATGSSTPSTGTCPSISSRSSSSPAICSRTRRARRTSPPASIATT